MLLERIPEGPLGLQEIKQTILGNPEHSLEKGCAQTRLIFVTPNAKNCIERQCLGRLEGRRGALSRLRQLDILDSMDMNLVNQGIVQRTEEEFWHAAVIVTKSQT